ncbi:MAG: hypothetical protein ACLTS9_05510 [Sutterella wadsworthensis]
MTGATVSSDALRNAVKEVRPRRA